MFWLISRRSQSSVSLSTSSPSLLPSVPLLSHSSYTHSLIVGCSHSVLKVEVGQHLCLVIGLLVICLFVWLFCSLCVYFGKKRERWLAKSNVANFCHPLCMCDGFPGSYGSTHFWRIFFDCDLSSFFKNGYYYNYNYDHFFFFILILIFCTAINIKMWLLVTIRLFYKLIQEVLLAPHTHLIPLQWSKVPESLESFVAMLQVESGGHHGKVHLTQ